MQRIGGLFVGVLLVVAAPVLGQQTAAGTALWRVAATTLAVPPALATGAGATFWNPAQAGDSARTQIAIEAVQTPAAIGASGMLAALRVRARSLGDIGLVYGRVGLSDLTRTTDSPDPTGSDVPVYTFALGATWARMISATNVGATLAFHETRLDAMHGDRWTIDVGASRRIAGDRIRVAAATHFFSSISANEPSQDIYAGVEARLWQGPLWGDRAALHGRYGLAFGHGFAADHHLGLGGEFAGTVSLDLAVVREGSYSESGWRPVGGIRVTIGKYRITLARDAGVNELGSAYRVGAEARFR
jgi:hypothetical protein